MGKAKNLKNRVSSYFATEQDIKTQQMLTHVVDIQFTITKTELEAFLLENQLIKQLRPKYNVVFRDDKSYPFIYLSTQDEYPRLSFYRGTQTIPGALFGPYPNTQSVKNSLNVLYRIFQLRQCEDHDFKTRTRPCLHHQLGQCSAPCVKLISQEAYQQDVANVQQFLKGDTQPIIKTLIQKMEQAATQQYYEQAAKYRDQITALRKVLQNQSIVTHQKLTNIDVLGIASAHDITCIHLLMIRHGQILGSAPFFPKIAIPEQQTHEKILSTFIQQYYLGKPDNYIYPDALITPITLPDAAILTACIQTTTQHHLPIKLPSYQSSTWIAMAQKSALASVEHRQAQTQRFAPHLESLRQCFQAPPFETIACVDVSHTHGQQTVAGYVIFNAQGPLKKQYRRFNIKQAKQSDDYGALTEALTQQINNIKQCKALKPDLLLIDGGKGQLACAEKVMQQLNLSDIKLIGIAKGAGRKPGLETLYLTSSGEQLTLANDTIAFHFMLQLRDEAHRFALTGHRKQRSRQQLHSVLEEIPGIGKRRRRELLQQLGGLQEIQQASLEELAQVPGISDVLAKRIYDAFHIH